MKSHETISKVIPQKGTFVEVYNRVLIGLITNSSHKGYLQSFKDDNATLYHIPPQLLLCKIYITSCLILKEKVFVIPIR